MSTQISISPVIKLEVNTTPITGGSAGQILFQTTGNTVGESANLSWNNTNLIFTLGSTATRILNFRPEDTTGAYGNSCSIRGGNGNGRLDFYSASNITEVRDNIILLTSVGDPSIQVGVSSISLNVASSTRLQVAPTTGNILIGTTTDAGYKLDVNGTARVQGSLSLTAGNAINIGNLQALAPNTGNDLMVGFNNSLLTFYTSNNSVGRFFSTGNFAIGTITDAGFRLDVNGTARVSGNTTFGGTIGSGGSSNFIIAAGNGSVEVQTTNPNLPIGSIITTGAITKTDNGTKNIINVNNAVTSTAANFNTLNGFAFTSTINQTLGTIRGIYIAPTLTASTDFRAIETTVGNVLLGTTSGNVGIGTSSPTNRLEVSGSSRFTTTINVGGNGSTGTSLSSGFIVFDNGNAVANSLVHCQAAQTSIFANPQSFAAGGFEPDSGGISSSNAIAFMNGSTTRMKIPLTGNVLIGTTTDAGFRLDVNGTARVVGSFIASAAIGAGTGSFALGTLATSASSTYGGALGYDAQSLNSHALAFGYSSRANGHSSVAIGRLSIANAADSVAFHNATSAGINSAAFGNGSTTTGASSMATGSNAYTYLTGQLAVSGGSLNYKGDSQFSIYTSKLNTGIVNSGGTYSFAGIRPSNSAFGSDVTQIWYVECVVVFAVKGRTTAITEFALRDTYSIKYKLAVKSTNSLGTTILGTPVADSSFSDASMATTSVTFTIVSNNLVVNVTPPTWTSGGQMQFIGTAYFGITELGVYGQPF